MKIREIEFRGLRTDGGGWIYGYYVYDECYGQHFIERNEPTGGDGYNEPKTDLSRHNVFPETVGQYIGVNDYEGTKIFEGDLITCETLQNLVVEFKDGQYWIGDTTYVHLLHHGQTLQVVGNVVDALKFTNSFCDNEFI